MTHNNLQERITGAIFRSLDCSRTRSAPTTAGITQDKYSCKRRTPSCRFSSDVV